jgi:hypothetical protein
LLLRAIANLDKAAVAFAPSTAAAPIAATPVAPTAVEAAGERRHVTAMFCDLVDTYLDAASPPQSRGCQTQLPRAGGKFWPRPPLVLGPSAKFAICLAIIRQ